MLKIDVCSKCIDGNLCISEHPDTVYLAPLLKLNETDFAILINGKHVVVKVFAENCFEYILYNTFEVGGEFIGIYHRTPEGIFKMLTSFIPTYPQAIIPKTIILGGIYTLKGSPGMGLEIGGTVRAVTQYHDGRVTVAKCDPKGGPDPMELTTWLSAHLLEFKCISKKHFPGVS